MFVFVCICIHAQACGFSSSHFSNFMKYLSKIILGQFKRAVPCKYQCSLLRTFLTCLILGFCWEGEDCKVSFRLDVDCPRDPVMCYKQLNCECCRGII